MNRANCRCALVAALLACVAAGNAAAAEQASVLGGGGQVFTLRTGSYKDLLPSHAGGNAANPILVLDVAAPGAASQRILVPGTDSADRESSPFLVYEPTSGAVFAVWQSQINVNTVLFLRSYQPAQGWSDPIEIYGNSFAVKSSPSLAITRDSYTVAATTGPDTTVHRTTLHLTWWEDADGGRVLYSPIVLLDGVYLGGSPAYVLNDLDSSPDAPSNPNIAPLLYESPAVLLGSRADSVVVAFANQRSGQLVTAQVGMLSGELSRLSDEVRQEIIDVGQPGLSDLNGLATTLRGHIIGGGRRLDAQVLNFLATALRGHIIGGGVPASAAALGDDARGYLLHSGAALLDTGNVQATGGGIATVDVQGSSGSAVSQVALFQLASLRGLPETGSGPHTLLCSETGDSVLVVWEPPSAPSQIFYRQWTEAGWGSPQQLTLSASLDSDGAYRLLAGLVRNH